MTAASSGAAGSALLSIVVLPYAGPDALRRCLATLAGQRDPGPVEVIVPTDATTPWAEPIATAAGARVAPVSSGSGHPARRAAGIAAARGALVALTEDHCLPEPDWASSIRTAHRAPHAAIGGTVDKLDGGGAVGWAIYLADYGRYMSPVGEGPAAWLTDCNVSYKRAALEAVADSWRGEFHETAVHWALQARGETLWLSPSLRVRQDRPRPLGAALRERFEHGWTFAGTRVAGLGAPKRAVYAAMAPLLPAVIAQRAARHVMRARRHGGAYLAALPAMLATGAAWAAGEIAGYVSGRGPRGGA